MEGGKKVREERQYKIKREDKEENEEIIKELRS